MSWLDTLRGRSAGPNLARLLAEYPPCPVPHPGPGRAITPAQAAANLAALTDAAPERLRLFAALLARFKIDLPAGLAAPAPRPLLDALWRWVGATWPAIRETRLVPLSAWQASPRDGADRALSLVADLALAWGELIRRHRPDSAWVLDLDPANASPTGDEGLPSWRQPVLQSPAMGRLGAVTSDLLTTAHNEYGRCAGPSFGVINTVGLSILRDLPG